MKKIKEYMVIIIIVLILILGAFYWFGLRPIQIKKECSTKYLNYYQSSGRLSNQGRLGQTTGEESYLKCLAEKGL